MRLMEIASIERQDEKPRSDKEDVVVEKKEKVKVEGRVSLPSQGPVRVGREGSHFEAETTVRKETRVPKQQQERVRFEEKDTFYNRVEDQREERPQRDIQATVEVSQSNYSAPYRRYVDAQIDVADRTYSERTYDREGRIVGGQASHFESTLDETERQYRQGPSYTQDFPLRPQGEVEVQQTSRITVDAPSRGAAPVFTEKTKTVQTTVDSAAPSKFKRDMGYYDDQGEYHSFRRGVQRAAERVADRIAHPIHGGSHSHHHHHSHSDDNRVEVTRERISSHSQESSAPVASSSGPSRSYESYSSASYEPTRQARAMPSNKVSIPCHHIRIGDLLYLQGRPCQVIRISTSAQTGQHRYLGVDLFTKQLHEESSFISNPSPSVVVQQMYGPVFKQYRVLDIRDDGRVVAMTEGGDIKQGLSLLDQSSLSERLTESFDSGRGSLRVLVLNDGPQELGVDFKVVHGSRL